MSREEAEAICAKAASEGVTVTLWVRRALFAAAGLEHGRAVRPIGRPPQL